MASRVRKITLIGKFTKAMRTVLFRTEAKTKVKNEKFVKFVNFVKSCQFFSKSKSDATNGVDDTIFQIHENGRIKLVNSLWHIWENVFWSRLKKIRQNV